MVGGIVVEVVEKPDRMTLEVRDQRYRDRVRVDVERGYCIEFGDAVWWQGGKVYWTPTGSDRRDVPIRKIGYSYSATINDM